jgi:2,3-diketo-5-methylthio-1-phosphopentane phosphatase
MGDVAEVAPKGAQQRLDDRHHQHQEHGEEEAPRLPTDANANAKKRRREGSDAAGDGDAVDGASPTKRARAAARGVRVATEGIKAILLDIEGTTTPISFVKEMLFPFSARRDVLERAFSPERVSGDRPASARADSIQYVPEPFQSIAVALRAQWLEDRQTFTASDDVGAPFDPVDYALALIAADRKVPALKALQGHLWRTGYESGELRGQVFPDVLPALRSWGESGIPVYIYSSGSVLAQKLLFGFLRKETETAEGESGNDHAAVATNALPLLRGHFDTANAGFKSASASYVRIADSIVTDVLGYGVQRPSGPSEILFVTDVLAEAVAARDAGLNAVLSDRPGNAKVESDSHDFAVVTSLAELIDHNLPLLEW